MGDCGGRLSLVHLPGVFSSDSSSSQFCGGAQEAMRLVLSPGTLAEPGAVWSPVAAWWQEGSQSAAGPETERAAQDWPVSSAECSPAPAGNSSL